MYKHYSVALRKLVNFNNKTAGLLLGLFIILTGGCVPKVTYPVKSKQTLRLGVGNYYFWNIYSDGQFSGAVVDIWREIAKQNSLEIDFILIENMQHLQKAMEDNSIDVFCSLRKTSERTDYMYFIEPPFRTKLKVLTYVKADSGILIEKYEDMHGKNIALVDAGYDRLNSDTNINKETIGWNTAEAFDKLLTGNVDAVHISEWRAIWYLRDGKHKDQIDLANYSYSEYHPCYLVMSKKSAFAEKWKDIFGQTIQQMIDDGTMKRIIDSYVSGWYEYCLPCDGLSESIVLRRINESK